MSANEKPGRDPARWEQRYLDDELPWDSGKPDLHLGRVVEAFGIRGGRVLDIGCGTGTNAVWLSSQGFTAVGCDLSPTAIERARTRAQEAGVECQWQVGDFLTGPAPEGPFEFVYDRGCFHVFDEAEERTRFATRIAELLQPEGLWHSLIGSTDGPDRDTGPPRRSAAQITAAVEPHFEILQLKSVAFDEGLHAEARAWVLVAKRRVS